jgi:hypothetical protein
MPTEVLPQVAAQFPWHATWKPTPVGGAGMAGGNVISRTAVAMDVRQQEPETGKPMRPGVPPRRCRRSSIPQCELPQLLND